MTSDRSCWTCAYQRKGGHLTFLGICGWFAANGREPKEITPAIVDVGCKFHEPRAQRSAHKDEVFVEGQPVGEYFTEGMSDV
jgi:hypothetical protein